MSPEAHETLRTLACAAAVVLVLGAPAACTMREATLKAGVMAEGLKAGKDPIALRCAVDNMQAPACVIKALEARP